MTTLKKHHNNKRLKRRRRLLVLLLLLLLLLVFFFSNKGRGRRACRRFSHRDPGEDPYEHNSAWGRVRRPGFHYDGLSFLDPHKSLERNGFRKVRERKICSRMGVTTSLRRSLTISATNRSYWSTRTTTNRRVWEPSVARVFGVLCDPYILDDRSRTRKLDSGRIVSARVAGTIVTFRKSRRQTEYETPEGVYRGEGALVKKRRKTRS